MQIAVVAAVVTSIKSAGAYKQDMNQTDLSNPPIDLDKPDSPVDVHLLVNSNKVYGLDVIGMQYKLGFYLYFSWRDDRQKSGNVVGDDLRMNTVWSPRPEIMNREGGDSSSPSCVFQLGAPAFTLLNITKGKWCLCQTRVQARLDPASTRNLGPAILMCWFAGCVACPSRSRALPLGRTDMPVGARVVRMAAGYGRVPFAATRVSCRMLDRVVLRRQDTMGAATDSSRKLEARVRWELHTSA